MKAIALVLAFLFLVGVALLLLFFIGWLPVLLTLLGLAVFVAILAAAVVAGLVVIVALPYYLVTKRAATVSGQYGLDQVREK